MLGGCGDDKEPNYRQQALSCESQSMLGGCGDDKKPVDNKLYLANLCEVAVV